jgi:hypothetical protein
MLRDRWLGDAELPLDHRADVARGLLAVGEHLHDAPPDGVAQDVERVHAEHCIARDLYKQGLI